MNEPFRRFWRQFAFLLPDAFGQTIRMGRGLGDAFTGSSPEYAVQSCLSLPQLAPNPHLCSASAQDLDSLGGDVPIHVHVRLISWKCWLCNCLITGFHPFPLSHRGRNKQPTINPGCKPSQLSL